MILPLFRILKVALPAAIRATLLRILPVVLTVATVHATNLYYVDTAAHFNAGKDKDGAYLPGASASSPAITLGSGDRIYLKGGTNWGGIINTITGSMTDAEAQSNPAVIYACNSSYTPTVGGVTVAGLCEIDLAGTGIVFAGVTFGPSSGMYKAGAYTDYSGNDGSAYIIALAAGSRYMTVSHVKFDHCGLTNTDYANNDHYGSWLYVLGYRHTIQYCEAAGRDFDPNDINVADYTRHNSIRDATIKIYKSDSLDTTDYGYHTIRYCYFGERKIPASSDVRLAVAQDGSLPADLSNGWETIRIGNSSFVDVDFNVTVEHNVFYHSLQAYDGLPGSDTGEPEVCSNKSRRNTYRYNTFLNSYGALTLRQGDYCVVQGNYFLAGGAYDSSGQVVLTETRNTKMGGVRAYGFGHTISNNYFYKIAGTATIHTALCLGSGATDPGTTASLINGSNGAAYETANYTQVFGNTFIDCGAIILEHPDSTVGVTTYKVNGTQFTNNLIYYSSDISATGIAGNTDSSGNPDSIANHGGTARGNYIYSQNSAQLGDAVAMFGTANNIITTTANPLMTGSYDVLTIPAATSPVIGQAVTLPAVNDTSSGNASYNLAGNVSINGGLDVRGLSRPGTGRDIGDYERESTGTAPIRPLYRSEVGIVPATYPNYPVIAETFPGNTRTTQDPPTSLHWYCSGVVGSNTTLSSGAMTWTSTSSTRQAIGYFPTQTLAIGDVLTLSYNFKVTGPLNVSRGLRAGLLYNGTNTKITTDTGANPSNYTGTGYGSFINPAPTAATPDSLVKRGPSSGTIATTPVGTTWATLASGGATQSLVANTTYAATLTIRKTAADQVILNTTYSGSGLTPVTVTTTDPSGTYSTFDTVVLAIGNSVVSSVSYSNISVTKTTPLTASVGSASAVVGSVIDINLKTLVTNTSSPFNPLTFTVSSPLNGTVSLLSNGYTARFTPTAGYTGAASFSYSVTDGTASASSSVSLNFSNKIAATVTLGGLEQSYDGTAKSATATTSPAITGTVVFTYDGSAVAPSGVGSYAVVGTINDAVYSGVAAGTLVISKGSATITLGNLTQNYDGTAKSVTTTTNPAGLTVDLTYDDGTGPTSDAPIPGGTYAVNGTINDTNYEGTVNGIFYILSPPTALAGTATTVAGIPVSVDLLTLASDANTAPSNLRFSLGAVTNGIATLGADGHTVLFTPAANYTGPATFTYTVTDVTADSRTLLNYTFQSPDVATDLKCSDVSGNARDGTFSAMTGAGVATYTSDYPSALYPQQTQSVNLYQNANTDATKLVAGLVGNSTIDFQIADWTAAGWFKRTSATDQDIIFHLGAGIGNGATNDFTLAFSGTTDAIALRNWNSTVNDVNIATTATAGAWHHFAIVRGGTTLTLYLDGTNVGSNSAFSFTFSATTTNVAIFGAASGSTSTYVRALNGSMADLGIFSAALSPTDITKLATAPTANLGGQTASNSVSVTVGATVPAAPTSVSATAGDGQATVSFTAPANTGGATITSYTVTASPGGATATGSGSPITVSGLTNGIAYTFTVTATNSVGTGPASGASSSATPNGVATITLGSLLQAFNGSPKFATASTIPAGLTVNYTYNGSSTAPSAVGTYTVVGTVNEVNYSGTATGTLVITSAAAATFVTTSPWICPANVTSVQVQCWGGGGAGGSAYKLSGTNTYGGGGAGGAYAKLNSCPVVPGQSYTVTVGAGGVTDPADSVAKPGGASWFGSSTTVIANGGAGGQSKYNDGTISIYVGAGGAGDSNGCIGDQKYAGGSGASGNTASGYGGGGGSSAGSNANGNSATSNVGALTTGLTGAGAGGDGKISGGGSGSQGGVPGAGGGGARGSTAATQWLGGPGTAGQVILQMTVNSTTAPSSLGYSVSPAIYTKGTAISSNSPTSSGGAVVSYSVSPTLPPGLVLNTTTGVISGTPSAVTLTTNYTITATNSGGSTTASVSITVNDISATAPTVITPTSSGITATTAILGGNVTSDGGATITELGVFYAPTLTNNNPQVGGSGVIKVIGSGNTGVFTVSAGSLAPGIAYTFAAYAVNSRGTSYSVTGSFTTPANDATLSALTLGAGSLNTAFASTTLSYTSSVSNTIISTTLTPTATQANATIKVNGASVTSGSASGGITLNVGTNTLTTVVTAQDGTTTKTYTVTVTRQSATESWRQLYFNTTANSGNAADSEDPDGDGLTNEREYVFGTDPTVPGTGSFLSATNTGSNLTLVFVAQQATGTGYTGLTRYYTVEVTTDLTNSASWLPLAGYSDVAGANQTVSITPSTSGTKSFYRLKVRLQ